MNLPAALFAIRCLIHDTFRQSLASRVFWITLVVSGLCIMLCLSISIEGGQSLHRPGETELVGPDDRPYTGANPKHGELSLAFGAIKLGLFRDAETEVHFLQSVLAKWIAGAIGTLLALIWTAGFLPEFLQPSAASVLLAKPVPRWSLLVGKFLGVLCFVAFQASIFVGGTWAALGVKTGIWLPGYLLTIPLLLLNFAVIYSFSTLLAVMTRSTVACVFGSILFWLLCCAMNFGRHAGLAQQSVAPEAGAYPSRFLFTVEAGYWILPKPVDMGYLLQQALGANKHFATMPEFQAVIDQGAFYPELSLLTSILFCVGMLAIAARQLVTTDY